MESWAWREILGVVFERKGVISKYCGIRSYDFCVMKVVFLAGRGRWLSIRFSKNVEMGFGAARQSPLVRRVACCPNSGVHRYICSMGMSVMGVREICDEKSRWIEGPAWWRNGVSERYRLVTTVMGARCSEERSFVQADYFRIARYSKVGTIATVIGFVTG